MNTVGEICTAVSRDLNDQRPNNQFTRWTRAMLVDYLSRGIKEIAAYKPEAFARTIELSLVPGRVQHVPEGVTLRGVGAGQGGQMAHKSDDSLLRTYVGYAPCPPRPTVRNGKVVYAVRTFAVDSADPSLFYVSPPVPAGTSVKVQAQVDGIVQDYGLEDWDKPVVISDKYYNNLLTYMRAQAYAVDNESAVSLAESSRLLSLFYQVMGVKYKIEAAKNSGYENGRVGTGDPRSARV